MECLAHPFGVASVERVATIPAGMRAAAMTGKQIAVTTTLLAKPGEEKALMEVLEALAEAVRREEGCLLYEPVRSAHRPERFLVIERYRDAQALVDHVNAAHFREALPGLMDRLASTPDQALYESFERD
jgi:quinol monooxygenase YgiN